MPNLLAAIGMASPAIRQTMTDIEERPKQALRWGWEKEQYGQQKAINEFTLKDLQTKEAERIKKEEYNNEVIDVMTDPGLMDKSQEGKNYILNDLKSKKVIDEKGLTPRWKYNQWKMEMAQNPSAFQPFIDIELKSRRTNYFKAVEKLKKEQMNPAHDPMTIEKLENEVEMAHESYQKVIQKDTEQKTVTEFHSNLMNSRNFLKQLKNTGQLDGFNQREIMLLTLAAGVKGVEGAQEILEKLVTSKSGTEKGESPLGKLSMDMFGKNLNELDANQFKAVETKFAELEGIKEKPENDPVEIRQFEMETGISPKLRGSVEYQNRINKWRKDKTGRDETIDLRKIAAAQQMSNQFDRNPITQHYRIASSFTTMLDAAEKEAKTTNNFIAVDQTYGNVIQKLLDPNAIRIEEYRRTKEDQAAINKMRGYIAKQFVGGAGFTPEDRAAISRMIKAGMDQVKSAYIKEAKTMRRKAEKANLDPDLVAPIDWEGDEEISLRERAIIELEKRGKVINEDTISQAMKLLEGK